MQLSSFRASRKGLHGVIATGLVVSVLFGVGPASAIGPSSSASMLKICVIAGPSVAVGTAVSFTVTGSSSPVSVVAGVVPKGYCTNTPALTGMKYKIVQQTPTGDQATTIKVAPAGKSKVKLATATVTTGKLASGVTRITYTDDDPSGRLWFTDVGSIKSMTTSGVISTYTGNCCTDDNFGITDSPSGTVWITNVTNGLGSIATSGVTSKYGDGDSPRGITAGPDGLVWFTNAEAQYPSIGVITTPGDNFTTYTAANLDSPNAIAPGPDGNLWFTNYGTSIGKITIQGAITLYSNADLDDPQGITTGPDGALWFTNTLDNTIGRITTKGTFTYFSSPTIDDPMGITAGPDEALWFTNSGNNTIGRITTSGVVTNYTGTGIDLPTDITVGPDGALWFTNSNNASIGRITTSGIVTNYQESGIQGPGGITSGP